MYAQLKLEAGDAGGRQRQPRLFKRIKAAYQAKKAQKQRSRSAGGKQTRGWNLMCSTAYSSGDDYSSEVDRESPHSGEAPQTTDQQVTARVARPPPVEALVPCRFKRVQRQGLPKQRRSLKQRHFAPRLLVLRMGVLNIYDLKPASTHRKRGSGASKFGSTEPTAQQAGAGNYQKINLPENEYIIPTAGLSASAVAGTSKQQPPQSTTSAESGTMGSESTSSMHQTTSPLWASIDTANAALLRHWRKNRLKIVQEDIEYEFKFTIDKTFDVVSSEDARQLATSLNKKAAMRKLEKWLDSFLKHTAYREYEMRAGGLLISEQVDNTSSISMLPPEPNPVQTTSGETVQSHWKDLNEQVIENRRLLHSMRRSIRELADSKQLVQQVAAAMGSNRVRQGMVQFVSYVDDAVQAQKQLHKIHRTMAEVMNKMAPLLREETKANVDSDETALAITPGTQFIEDATPLQLSRTIATEKTLQTSGSLQSVTQLASTSSSSSSSSSSSYLSEEATQCLPRNLSQTHAHSVPTTQSPVGAQREQGGQLVRFAATHATSDGQLVAQPKVAAATSATAARLPSEISVRAPKRVVTMGAMARRTNLPAKAASPPDGWRTAQAVLRTSKLPITGHEPLSYLQCLTEELAYSRLLDTAMQTTCPLERMTLVTCFAISAYANSAWRSHKPFNPLVSETYEYDRTADFGWKYVAEQVSHNPDISACDATGTAGWHWQQVIEAPRPTWSFGSLKRMTVVFVTPPSGIRVTLG